MDCHLQPQITTISPSYLACKICSVQLLQVVYAPDMAIGRACEFTSFEPQAGPVSGFGMHCEPLTMQPMCLLCSEADAADQELGRCNHDVQALEDRTVCSLKPRLSVFHLSLASESNNWRSPSWAIRLRQRGLLEVVSRLICAENLKRRHFPSTLPGISMKLQHSSSYRPLIGHVSRPL